MKIDVSQYEKPKRMSFSQWENYNGCPRRWFYKSVQKLPSTPPGPAAARGLDMHDRVERYIKGEIDLNEMVNGDPTKRFGDKKPAKVVEKFILVIDQFREHPNGDRYTERRLGFDDEWYLSGSASQTTKTIVVLDAARCLDRVLHIGEWKSGKPKDTHSDQRKMYALAGLRTWLHIDRVEVTTHYLEGTAPSDKLVAEPRHVPKLKELWDGRFALMLEDKVCAPKPHEGCRWCDYAKSKGGPCSFGG